MLKLLGVPRSKVLEWSIRMAKVSIDTARFYEPEKVQMYEKHLQELKQYQAIEQMYGDLRSTSQNNHR